MTDRAAERTIVLTGATSGIGLAAAQQLARDESTHLILHGPETESAVQPLLSRLGGKARIDYLQADFDNLDEVVTLAGRVRDLTGQVDVLVNNAGRPGPGERKLSANGYETTLQVNYLAAVLLTEHLMPLLLERPGGRVVHVSSATHLSADLELDDLQLERHPYSPTIAYARSKLVMIMHALWLARQQAAPTIVSISPGVISTGLLHAMYGVGGAPTEHGARNVVEAATASGVTSGAYLDDGSPAQPSRSARDHAAQDELHQLTTELLKPWQ
ncbi:short-chain dehydrogenase/reductase SDR [Kribbella flavida DSM 17836]|uniref:Short-chain dehydrogenase/reductase SDR n=1 Tax=Kribbella flavida (strain DSM 17836 / JCM 10339 / NBRC 14399) TaxID=479435 RepID=D2PLH0_KRIFD|nr:SDR family NAD(P)-dependent oxidoreductase [Kribbella flavida]ADB30599.1 short-chain dehydrogenase/reductase SDR [Kribbella flavida DSM 17836]